MRFSKKTAHRIIIALAMVFPIAYMLGTQIAVLAGAHGEMIISSAPSNSYTQKCDMLSNTWADANTGEIFTFSGYCVSELVPLPYDINYSYSLEFTGFNGNLARAFFYSEDSFILSRNLSTGAPVSFSVPSGNVYFRIGFDVGSLNDVTVTYTSVDSLPVESSVTYSESLFGSVFPRDNFIEKVGQNAIGVNPKGFTPFANMLRYIDVNMLHAGDTQIGLMFYGMVYWLLHVVLADLVYHVLVFIPNLICAIFTWFGRGLDDDKGE